MISIDGITERYNNYNSVYDIERIYFDSLCIFSIANIIRNPSYYHQYCRINIQLCICNDKMPTRSTIPRTVAYHLVKTRHNDRHHRSQPNVLRWKDLLADASQFAIVVHQERRCISTAVHTFHTALRAQTDREITARSLRARASTLRSESFWFSTFCSPSRRSFVGVGSIALIAFTFLRACSLSKLARR